MALNAAAHPCAARETLLFRVSLIRRGVREAEGARLESVYGLTPIEGSNPSLSANYLFQAPPRSIEESINP